ncbi:hypothetical protein ACOMHN_063102 [Nucella lapillus]
MEGELTLLLLLCGLAYASAYYIYGDRLDDDYFPRGLRTASYGFGPAARYYGGRPGVHNFAPTFSRYNDFIPLLPHIRKFLDDDNTGQSILILAVMFIRNDHDYVG